MIVTAKFEARGLILSMEKGQKKLAYATANAINETAKAAQTAVRAEVQQQYTVRRPQFLLRQAAIIRPFANARQGRPFAEISVGEKPRLLLSTLELGGERKPAKGNRVAVPVTGGPARPTFGAQVPLPLTFKGMKLRKVRQPKKAQKSATFKGQSGTFVLPSTQALPEGGVFQRQGQDVRLVYAFKQPMRLKPSLGFRRTVTQVAETMLEEAFERQVKKELLR